MSALFSGEPYEQEFALQAPPLERASSVEAEPQPQLDFSPLFGAVALFGVRHDGEYELEREAA